MQSSIAGPRPGDVVYRRRVLRSLASAAVAAVGVGLFAMSAAWSHNPQAEYHDPEGSSVQWGNWLSVGGLWAALTFPVAWLLSVLVLVFLPKRPQTAGYWMGGVAQILVGSTFVFYAFVGERNPAGALLGGILIALGVVGIVKYTKEVSG
jgi:hypothetical protein